MAKKSKKSMLPLLAMGLALIFAVLAIVFSLALDFAGTKVVTSSSVAEGSTIYKGIDVLFGTKSDSGDQILKGSAIGLAGFTMMIVGAVIILAGMVLSTKNGKAGKFFGAIGGLVLIVAGVLMFVAPSDFVKTNTESLNSILSTIGGIFGSKFEIASSIKVGAILSGIFGIVSGVAGAASIAVK